MANLLLTLPGGAEWLIFVFGLFLPALALLIVYKVAKKMMKESLKEAIRELKEEGLL